MPPKLAVPLYVEASLPAGSRTLKVVVKALSDNDSSQDANGESNKSQKTPVDRNGGGDVVSEDDGPEPRQQPAATAPPRIRLRLNSQFIQ
jgi:hypothetical protein